VFLKTNRRIEALITVICLALLIFCFIERAVRHALAPEVKMTGLVPGQKAKPTGRLIFQTLAGLRLIPATAGQPALIPQPTPVQARLLELLAVNPTQPP
jgi:transposase